MNNFSPYDSTSFHHAITERQRRESSQEDMFRLMKSMKINGKDLSLYDLSMIARVTTCFHR